MPPQQPLGEVRGERRDVSPPVRHAQEVGGAARPLRRVTYRRTNVAPLASRTCARPERRWIANYSVGRRPGCALHCLFSRHHRRFIAPLRGEPVFRRTLLCRSGGALALTLILVALAGGPAVSQEDAKQK